MVLSNMEVFDDVQPKRNNQHQRIIVLCDRFGPQNCNRSRQLNPRFRTN